MPPLVGVPLVGQPFTVVKAWSSVLLRCTCGSQELILVTGLGNIATCSGCGKHPVITSSGQVTVGEFHPMGAIA